MHKWSVSNGVAKKTEVKEVEFSKHDLERELDFIRSRISRVSDDLNKMKTEEQGILDTINQMK